MTSRVTDKRVNRAIEIMEISGRDAAQTTEAEFAASVNLSVSRFAHLFRQQTGMAPLEMLQSIRLQKCGRLLRETQLSIKEIAWQAGFRTSGGFARAFKKTFGTTPLEFRRNPAELESVPPPPGAGKTIGGGRWLATGAAD